MVGAITCLAVAWYVFPLGPFLDDGPFHGTPTATVTDRAPDQSFPIYNGMTVETFDPTAAGESPTVQLRQHDGAIRWAVRADGHEPGDVATIRFQRHTLGLTRSGTVYAQVEWTYGHEAAYWYITRNGDLRDYYYSW